LSQPARAEEKLDVLTITLTGQEFSRVSRTIPGPSRNWRSIPPKEERMKRAREKKEYRL